MNDRLGQAPQLGAVPPAMRDSILMRKGGFDIFRGLPEANTCTRLLEEARKCLSAAAPSEIGVSDDQEVRGGRPARRFLSANGGAIQSAFYQNPEVINFLKSLSGLPVRPTGGSGTYTYYVRAGDHLALHRDIETCDVAVITCLFDRHNPGSRGGFTLLYPGRQTEPLSRIRATSQLGSSECAGLGGSDHGDVRGLGATRHRSTWSGRIAGRFCAVLSSYAMTRLRLWLWHGERMTQS